MRLDSRYWAILALLALGGCSGSGGSDQAAIPPGDGGGVIPPTPTTDEPRTRYSFANGCFALKSLNNNQYLAAAGGSYAASAADKSGAEPFFLKPSALGEYLLYDHSQDLVAGTGCASGQTVCPLALASADDTARFIVKAAGDDTAYPAAPQYNVEPTPAAVTAYQAFRDPLVKSTRFTLTQFGGKRLAADGDGNVGLEAASDPAPAAEQFALEVLDAAACAAFPEAESGASGRTLRGTTADGRVLGMADVHVHTGSTTFLGNALAGTPFHKFGVTHALADCSPQHGSDGSRDIIGGFLEGGGDPRHATDGWPTFTDWPAKDNLTHQAIYWKWLERAWMAGLRIMVNDLVENGTLCELQRNNSPNPSSIDCDEMNEAGRQAGTMYAMQDYIDAQYGGPGNGWLRIVNSPAEAREVIKSGRLAMVLGIEISNFLGCQITYNPNPARKEPQDEPMDGPAGENSYACKATESNPLKPGEILYELQRIRGWGVQQVISIHEFDNAFGGNGVFFPIINLGNRENSGGIPSGSYTGGWTPSQTPTGEYWTTYDCPVEGTTAGFSGYFWDSSGGTSGADLMSFSQGNCAPGQIPGAGGTCVPVTSCTASGNGGRYGGTTPCYPDRQQCNARWLTPVGVYMYTRLMQMGFIFDFDHMEVAMKHQVLDMTETQTIPYPIVSTHGTFGGTTNSQAERVLKNGGFLYPSLGSSTGFMNDMHETRQRYDAAFTGAPKPLFGFGFGTDTNGLSGQAGTENDVVYPYTLEFANASVTFQQPHSGQRSWDIHTDGSAQYGMLSDMVEAMSLHGTPQDMTDLYNSAERYLRTWEQTRKAAAAFDPSKIEPAKPSILRQTPGPLNSSTWTPP